jgi:hypothetical protein
MDNNTRIAKLKETEYKELFGIQKPTFDKMLAILESAYEEKHKQGGASAAIKRFGQISSYVGLLPRLPDNEQYCL